jgi:hypothetical protein
LCGLPEEPIYTHRTAFRDYALALGPGLPQNLIYPLYPLEEGERCAVVSSYKHCYLRASEREISAYGTLTRMCADLLVYVYLPPLGVGGSKQHDMIEHLIA